MATQTTQKGIHRGIRVLGAAAAVIGLSAALSLPLASAFADTASPPAAPAANAPVSAPTAKPGGIEGRIASLHDQLKITADQEPKWQAVANVMRRNARTVHKLLEQRGAESTPMTAVDDLKSYEAITAAHERGLQRLIPAFEALYASLTDEQKQTADEMFKQVRHPEHRPPAPAKG